MLQKIRNHEGFTLIELMIVIAIIGILAAIAIPNFIAYRNRAYCKNVESDVRNTAAAIADYFAVPSRTNLPGFGDLRGISSTSGVTTPAISGNPNGVITIQAGDSTGRCPDGSTYAIEMGQAEGSWQ